MAPSDLESSLTPRTPGWSRILLAANSLSKALGRFTDPATAGDAWSGLAQHNLALGKPSTQSSISVRWSIGRTTDTDARRANNGVVDGTQGCHTDFEPFPWWQVDLKAVCQLREVRVFNRKDLAQRLKRFSILTSLDGNRWIEVFRKSDDSVFGALTLTPYVASLPPGTVGRFVRLQQHGTTVLHFNELQVFGEPADAPEAAGLEAQFIAQLDERVSRALAATTIPATSDDIDIELMLSQGLFPFPDWEVKRSLERRWILNDIPHGGIGAEVGVFRGHFSAVLLADLAPRKMYLVDPWEKLGEFFYWSDSYTNEGKFPTALARRDSVLRAAKFPACETVVVEDSFPACKSRITEQLDWIYIDASHRYEQTLAELKESAKIVKPGGYILGDDFSPDPTSRHHGVFRAVNEFLTTGPYQIVAAGPNGQWCIRCSGPERQTGAVSGSNEVASDPTGKAFREIFPNGRDYGSVRRPDFLRDIGRVHAAGGNLSEAVRVLEIASQQRADAFKIRSLLEEVRAALSAQDGSGE